MKLQALALALALALGALVAGCSDDPAPVSRREHRTTPPPPSTFEIKAAQALAQGNPADVASDRQQLGKMRAGRQKGTEWPRCSDVAKEYGRVAMDKTMLGVQEALMAAQVDDFVLCDKPSIYAAARAAAEAAVERLDRNLPARQMVDYMLLHAADQKMEPCWLKSLRTSRQDGSPYGEAMPRAEARCKPI